MLPILLYGHERHAEKIFDVVMNQKPTPRSLADFQNTLGFASLRGQIQQNHLPNIFLLNHPS